MDQLRGAIDSFTGGNNEQQTAQGTSGGGNFEGGLGSSQYSQQTPQGSSGRGNYAGGSAGGLGSNEHPQQAAQSTTGGGGFLGGLGNKLNAAAGGGQQSEKNEDYLDKGGLAQARTMRSVCADERNRCRFRSGEIPRSRTSEQRVGR